MSPGLYGPRPGTSDPERTPVVCHPRPSPVVMPSIHGRKGPPPLPPPRVPTPLGGTLAPLGKANPAAMVDPPRPEAIKSSPGRLPVPGSEVYSTDEAPTERGQRMAVMSKLLRTCDALPLEDVRLLLAFGLRLRPSAEG